MRATDGRSWWIYRDVWTRLTRANRPRPGLRHLDPSDLRPASDMTRDLAGVVSASTLGRAARPPARGSHDGRWGGASRGRSRRMSAQGPVETLQDSYPEPDSVFVAMYTISASLPQGPPDSTLSAGRRPRPWSSQLGGVRVYRGRPGRPGVQSLDSTSLTNFDEQ
jgi:hypothetical protein